MNIRRKARTLAGSLLVLAGLCGTAHAQYHVNEITPGVPVLRGIPTHVPGSSHNTYGPNTVAGRVEPASPTTVTPSAALYVQPNDTEDRMTQAWVEGQYGRNVSPVPEGFGRVASPARQRELLDEIKAKRNQANAAAPQAPAPGITAIQRRHTQIARRMAYNDRVKTRSEMELDYIQANIWWHYVNTPAPGPWQLLMDSATMYGYHGYGYGVLNRPYPVYGLGGPGCVPMSGY